MRLIKQRIIQHVLILALLFFGWSCAKPHYPSSSRAKSWGDFKLRYNAIHHIDKTLKRAEEDMVLTDYAIYASTLLGSPNVRHFVEMDSIIQKLHYILPLTKDTNLKEELYYKLGKAYFLKLDYYTAIAYFELISNPSLAVEAAVWKARSFRNLSKFNEAIEIANALPIEDLSKSHKSILYVLKTDFFLTTDQVDSAVFYLQLAIDLAFPKRYKPYWMLQLGKLYMDRDMNLAHHYLKKVAGSNTVAAGMKIEANLTVIKLKYADKERCKAEMLRVLDKGYSTGYEGLIYAAVAQEYVQANNLDSATMYFDKVFDHGGTSIAFKNLARWQLVELYLATNQMEDARNTMAEVIPDSLALLDKRAAILLANQYEWLELLEASKELEKQQSADTGTYHQALYNLVCFYKDHKLNEDALKVIKKLVNLTANSHVDYLHELALLDSNAITNTNNVYSQILDRQKDFYAEYEYLYTDYTEQNYDKVIARVNTLLKDNRFTSSDKSRLAYLQAFAIGHIQPVDSLLSAFAYISANFMGSPLLTLVENHLTYVKNNITDFKSRKFALERASLGFLVYQPEKALRETRSLEKDTIPQNIGTFIDYQLPIRVPYYFVVMVENPHVNLTPSRYAIGQFLRTRYRNANYGHHLSLWGDSLQIITVGIFGSLDEAKGFEANIVTFLPQIIKVGEKKYTTFVIPKSTLESSKDKSHLDEYLEKYINK